MRVCVFMSTIEKFRFELDGEEQEIACIYHGNIFLLSFFFLLLLLSIYRESNYYSLIGSNRSYWKIISYNLCRSPSTLALAGTRVPLIPSDYIVLYVFSSLDSIRWMRVTEVRTFSICIIFGNWNKFLLDRKF